MGLWRYVGTQADKNVTVWIALKEMVNEVVETRNPFAPWKGVDGKLYTSPQQKLQYFYCYSTLMALFQRYVKRKPTTFEDLVLGYFSALQGTITTLPLAVTLTRQVVENNQPFWSVFFSLWKKDGFMAFYRTWASSALLCINPAITFVMFEQIKRIRLEALKLPADYQLTAWEAFVVGALSKAAATVITFPLIRTQTMQRTWDKTHPGETSPSFLEVFPRVVKDEGLRGLYTGINTQIFKAVLNAALMLAIKEQIEGRVKLAVHKYL